MRTYLIVSLHLHVSSAVSARAANIVAHFMSLQSNNLNCMEEVYNGYITMITNISNICVCLLCIIIISCDKIHTCANKVSSNILL